MLFRVINAVLGFLTRPYVSTQEQLVLIFQSYLPEQFDEKSLYILFGFLTLCALLIAYLLSRCITLKDADDDPIYQRTKLYSTQRKHQKIN